MVNFKLRPWLAFVGLLSLAAVGSWLTFAPQPVQASTFGRPLAYGYYSGKEYSKGKPDYYWYSFMFQQGLPASWDTAPTDVDIFVDDVRQKLYSGSTIDQARVSMVVNTMMGLQAQDPRYDGPQSQRFQNGITAARDQFNKWERIVRMYDTCTNPGKRKCTIPGASVNFNEMYAYSDTVNGYGVGETGGTPQVPDVVFASIGNSIEEMVVFHHPNGTAFSIKKKCGNLTGDQSSFPDSPPSGELNPPTLTPGVPPGYQPGDPAVSSSCQSITGWARDPNNVSYQVPVTVTFTVPGSPPVIMPPVKASANSPFAFSVDTPASVRSSLKPVQVTAEGRGLDGSTYPLNKSSITIGPCITVQASCVNVRTTPARPDPSVSYSVKATVQYGSAENAKTVLEQSDFKFYLKITGPNGPTVVYDNKKVPGATANGNQVSVEVINLPPTNKTGTYDISWGVTGTYGAVSCGSNTSSDSQTDAFTSLNKPYFNVKGADVSVGAAMSAAGPSGTTECTINKNPQASVVGWSVDMANGNYGGAGNQFAAFAPNHLQEFATAQGNTTLPIQPSGLAFANDGLLPGDLSPTTGLYGGKLDGSSCVANYFAAAKPTNTTTGRTTLSSLTAADFGTGAGVPNGGRFVYYVDGDLLVDRNIAFSGTYGEVSDMPVFAVVVKGNIYVQPGVQQLDGFYIAQSSAANPGAGIIYSCAPFDYDTNALNVLKGTLQEACKTQLTVNGAFLSRQIWLLRTAGSVTTTPAEVFNYVPELWLTSPFGNGLSSNYSDYDAITSLPPVL